MMIFAKKMCGVFLLSALLLSCNAQNDLMTTTGTLKVALLSTGSDGATYQMPADARLTFSGPASGVVYLDGDEEVTSQELAPGQYVADIRLPGQTPGIWPLLRTAPDGTSSTIQASLVTEFPLMFDIVEGQSTGLTLQFQTNLGQDIIFSIGTLEIDMIVTSETSEFTDATFYNSNANAVTVSGGSNYSSFVAALNNVPYANFNFIADVELTSGWAMTSVGGEACADATVSLRDDTPLDPLMAAMLSEIEGYPGRICVESGNTLFFHFERVGIAGSSEVQSYIGNSNEYIFRWLCGGLPPGQVWTGESRLAFSNVSSPVVLVSMFCYFAIFPTEDSESTDEIITVNATYDDMIMDF